MELIFEKIYRGTCVELENKFGLERGDIQQIVIEDNRMMVTVPDDKADDIRDLIEPYKAREAFRLSPLYGLTHEQLDTYVDNINTMAEAKEMMRKMAHSILYLVKQTRLDS